MSSSSVKERFQGAERVRGQGDNVWVEFNRLAAEVKPVNMGQGFPDFPPPTCITDALKDIINSGDIMVHQYSRGFGHPRLVNNLSKLYSTLLSRPVDAMKDILVTIGAYEALFSAILGHINPGDEVIIIEPFFDCYQPMVELAGGKCVFVPLRPPKKSKDETILANEWKLDSNEFEASFTTKTKMVIINTPHNPLGKIFSRDELTWIGGLCEKNNCIVLSDEVYEWLVYGGQEHVRIASLPGMWERTITTGSVGKTFSVTGWKLGWAYGPEHLVKPMTLVHQNSIYCCPTILQEAVARAFEKEVPLIGKPESYWGQLAKDLEKRRDHMISILNSVNMRVTIPQGGYFIIADHTDLSKSFDYSSQEGKTKDDRFAKWLSRNKKLQGIPPYCFYSEGHRNLIEDYIRFCFFKNDTTFQSMETVVSTIKTVNCNL